MKTFELQDREGRPLLRIEAPEEIDARLYGLREVRAFTGRMREVTGEQEALTKSFERLYRLNGMPPAEAARLAGAGERKSALRTISIGRQEARLLKPKGHARLSESPTTVIEICERKISDAS